MQLGYSRYVPQQSPGLLLAAEKQNRRFLPEIFPSEAPKGIRRDVGGRGRCTTTRNRKR